MKYIKKFNEAIIDPESDNIKSFYEECLEIIDRKNSISPIEMKKIGENIAKELDQVEFDDIQSGFNIFPDSFQFTCMLTKSTFLAYNKKDAEDKLKKMRFDFGLDNL